MKISTKGRYAVRVMLDLALHNTGEHIKVKQIAERQGGYVRVCSCPGQGTLFSIFLPRA